MARCLFIIFLGEGDAVAVIYNYAVGHSGKESL